VNRIQNAPDFAQYGFPYPQNLIQAFVGGSQLHGAKVAGTDDTDWYGVYIEPPSKMMGLDRNEFFVFTTGGKEGGNGPADVDVCLYTLRKWAGMAAKGNPSRCISYSPCRSFPLSGGRECVKAVIYSALKRT
jgi:hypothetical protein